MRDGAPVEVMTGAYRYWCRMTSWLGSDVVADDVPFISGQISVSVDQQVPERLSFTVPAVAQGVSWVPNSPADPLARFGQYVDVTAFVQSAVTGETYDTPVGRFQIQAWDHDQVAGLVSVEAVGLLQRAADDRFARPVVPRSGGTLASEFARLMVDGIPVQVDGALVDRACPQSFQWDDDRLSALYEIVDAWPARLRVDEFGTARLLPPLPTATNPADSVLWFSDGPRDKDRGVLISSPTNDTRDGVYNRVVARSSQTDDPSHPPVTAIAYVADGALAVDGPYGSVTKFWSSPLATTTATLSAAAKSLLETSVRGARERVVSCPPNPTVEVDDATTVVTGSGTADELVESGWVIGYDLPLTGEAMTVRVGVSI